LATGLSHVAMQAVNPAEPGWMRLQGYDVVAVVAVLLSVGLYFYTRAPDRDPHFILNLGLAYLVLTGLGIGVAWHLGPTPEQWMVRPAISWVGALIVM